MKKGPGRPEAVAILTKWTPVTVNSKRQKLYGKTRQDVATKLTEALKAREEGRPIAACCMTVRAWFDYWLDHVVKPEREPKTYEGYEILVRLHLKPALAKMQLGALQPEDVECCLRDAAGNKVGARTRQSALTRLRTALNLAVKRGHVHRNVAEMVEMPKSRRRRIAPPSMDDLNGLLKAIRDDRQRAMVRVALGPGLRRGEVLGLQWEGVDLEARTLTVSHRVNRVQGLGVIVQQGAKTDSGQRTVMLPQIVVDTLRDQRRHQVEDRLAAGPPWKGLDYVAGNATGFVFTSAIGTVLEPQNVNRYFDSVRERVGLEGHTFHGLRHDFASLLLASGVPGRVVMEMMGHSNYSMTANRYQHVPDALQREAADRLDVLLMAAG